MISIQNTRFGNVNFDDSSVINFPNGIIGFPNETQFVLLERDGGGTIAFLQSLNTPALALPVMDANSFGNEYPNPNPADLAKSAGIGGGDVVTLVVVAAHEDDPCLSANLLAPIVVDANTKNAAQVVLDPRRYSAWYPMTTMRTTSEANAIANG